MSWHATLYYVVLPFCCAYAWWRGGWPERFGAALLLVGSIATIVVRRLTLRQFHSVEVEIMLIDLATLAGFVGIAWLSARFWILCAAGQQAATVAVHLARIAAPTLSPFAYAVGSVIWSFGLEAAIIAGTWRHHRRMIYVR